MPTFLRELRFALRRWARTPGFTAVALLTLGVGVGVDTAVFTVADAVLLRPLPLRDPGRLAVLRHHPPSRPGDRLQLSHPLFRALDEATPDIPASAVAASLSRMVLTAEGGAKAIRVAPVSGDFVETLGARTVLGSSFGPELDRVGAGDVIVLSHGLWVREFGADPGIVGRIARLEGRSHRILGVLAPGAGYPRGAEAWIPVVPFAGETADDPGVGFLEAVVRLPDDGGPAAASLLEAAANRYLTEEGPGGPPVEVSLTPLEDAVRGPFRPALTALLVAAGLVLLAACSNVANLLHIRAVRRRRELAVRTALGAGRRGLALQLAGEGTVLGLAAGAVGLSLAMVGVPALLALSPTELHGQGAATFLHPRVLLFWGAATTLATVLATSGTLLRIPRRSPARDLRASGAVTAGPGERRVPGVAVSVQVAVATVVVIGAGALFRSFLHLRSTDFGFDREGIVSAEVVPPPGGFEGSGGGDGFFDALVASLEARPGVDRAAGVLLRPLQGPQGFDYPFTVEGQDPAEQAENPLLNYEAVTPGYFRASGISLLRGRGFTAADREDSAPVAVVSRSLAERHWPRSDPVGRRLKWGSPDSDFPWVTVVGVAADARYRSLEGPGLDVYVPHRQSPWPLRHLVVRVRERDPGAVVDAIRRTVGELAPGARVMAVATPADLVADATAGPRYAAALLGVLAVLALLLAVVGIYGVLAWAVTDRRRELAIRVALGAPSGSTVRLAMGEGLGYVSAGLVAGLGAAVLGGRLASGALAMMPDATPSTYGGAAAVLLTVGTAACWIPARRAEKIDPVAALRGE